MHYRVYCLEVLQNLYQNLSVQDKAQVDTILSPYGELTLLENLDSGLMADYQLPLAGEPRHVSKLQKLALMVTGTPWDKPLNKHRLSTVGSLAYKRKAIDHSNV